MEVIISHGGRRSRICLPELRDGALNKEQLNDLLVEHLLSSDHQVNSYAFHLLQINWVIFGVLTWKDESIRLPGLAADKQRSKDFWHLIGATCSKLRLLPRKLLVYRKTEVSAANQAHCHFLIGKQGTEHVSLTQLCNTIRDTWTKNGKGLPYAVLFDKERNTQGVLYQSKLGFDFDYNDSFSRRLQTEFRRNSALVC